MRQSERMQLIRNLVNKDTDIYKKNLKDLDLVANNLGFNNIFDYYLSLSDEKLLQIEKAYLECNNNEKDIEDDENYFQLGDRIIISKANSTIVSQTVFFVKECIEEYTDEDIVDMLNHIGFESGFIDIQETSF